MTHIAIFLLAGALWAILYGCATFEYRIDFEANRLIVRWKIFGRLPFNRRRIPIEKMQDVRPFRPRDLFPGLGEIWGNFPARNGIVVQLHRRFLPLIWLTPPEPESFIEDLRNYIFAHRLSRLDLDVGAA